MNAVPSPTQRGLITSTITLLFDPKGRVTDSTTVEKFTPLPKPSRSELGFSGSQKRKGTESLAQELKTLAQLFFRKQRKAETFRPRKVKDHKEGEAYWNRLMTGCRELKRELAGQWMEAADSINVQKSEWEEARTYCETMQSRGPFKTNPVYKKKRTWLQRKLKEKPDPSEDLDREIILRVVSPTAKSGKRFVSIEDMTPGRLQSIYKAGRRGFGGPPLPVEELISNLNSLKSASARDKKWESLSLDAQDPSHRSAERFYTEPPDMGRSIASPVNEFITKEQKRYVRNPVSHVVLAKKKAVESSMNRIRLSPDIQQRVQQMEDAEKLKRLHFLRVHTGHASQKLGHKTQMSQLSLHL